MERWRDREIRDRETGRQGSGDEEIGRSRDQEITKRPGHQGLGLLEYGKLTIFAR